MTTQTTEPDAGDTITEDEKLAAVRSLRKFLDRMAPELRTMAIRRYLVDEFVDLGRTPDGLNQETILAHYGQHVAELAGALAFLVTATEVQAAGGAS